MIIFKKIKFFSSLLLYFFIVNSVWGQEDSISLSKVYLEQAQQIYKEQKVAIEIAWGDRQNKDGRTNDALRLQIMGKFNF